MKRRTSRISRKTFITALAVLAIIAAGIFSFIFYSHLHSSTRVVTVGKPADQPKVSTVNSPAQKTSPSNTSGVNNSGGATDTKGSVSATTNASEWVKSASGVITVKQPVANGTLHDGSTIAGSASADQVSYRLYDNKVGKIAEGTLSVVNGDFSGTLHFQPQGTGGRLDVYTTDSLGREYNEVQINVGF